MVIFAIGVPYDFPAQTFNTSYTARLDNPGISLNRAVILRRVFCVFSISTKVPRWLWSDQYSAGLVALKVYFAFVPHLYGLAAAP